MTVTDQKLTVGNTLIMKPASNNLHNKDINPCRLHKTKVLDKK